MKKQNAEKITRMQKRKACPLCNSRALLSEGPDQFCLSCDWDTCAEYVERGLMNNLEVAFKEHFLMKQESASVTQMSPPAKDDDHQAEPSPVEVSA